MNVKVLEISLHGQAVGLLFQYGLLCRFVAHARMARQTALAPRLSLSMVAVDVEAQAALWRDVKNPLFNAAAGRLPAFFQNLLPEGVLRTHIAQMRGCAEDDHFELLAACGGDLPGAVGARPVEVGRDTLQRLVTQDQDALEMSVVAYPLAQGISVSGVQPKIALLREGGRYVAPRRVAHRPADRHADAADAQHEGGQQGGRDGGREAVTDAAVRIIAKLPVVGRPGMPLLEKVSLDLARAAGVDTCDADLAPLSAIDADHRYTLPDEPHFLAVRRFDRDGARRIHFEDFAQILSIDAQHKYRGSYLDMARAMMPFPSLAEPAVLELLRRITVNDLLGNPDAHLKNFGVIFPDGVAPQLAPAYDVVAYAALYRVQGHALTLTAQADDRLAAAGATAPRGAAAWLTPARLRAFCVSAGIGEPLARRAVADTVDAAASKWPALLAGAGLPAAWHDRLQERLEEHPLLAIVRRRRKAVPASHKSANDNDLPG